MKVALYGQFYKPEDKIYIEELLSILTKKNISVVVEQNFYKGFSSEINQKNIDTFSCYEDLDNSFSYMFTLGGDGTILRAVTYIRDKNIPIVGINTGRLGFLANVQKDEIDVAVDFILEKKYKIKERSVLHVATNPIIPEMHPLNFALNEVSVSRKNTASMITVDTYLDNEYLTSYWADGLIIATPTGSTGYSLSCGGPIIAPTAKSFALTPIAPHNLSARPMVIPDETIIDFNVKGREDEFLLSLDSRIVTINSAIKIEVKKADFSLKMVQISEQTFLKTLREKLLWGQDTRN
ncbi:NAD kinase [Lutibacter sp. TH_r2]|uniref:NAD kinase n=1 Tax=Lutibacter sp. TH_r2 TaxID=3082083 RepID=UPI00295304E4|nr:NAD kinase [Lutibacter sp. TH_r2]MDV7187877.1 NAD kinase [Lutibacter sp. TH_r2]